MIANDAIIAKKLGLEIVMIIVLFPRIFCLVSFLLQQRSVRV